MIAIVDEAPAHAGAREALLDLSFGFDRQLKTSERLREGRLPVFAFSALDDDERLIGTVRLWAVRDDRGNDCLLLGPLAVDPNLRGQKVGDRLMRHALNQAAVFGHQAILLVGDHDYYARFGFRRGLLNAVGLPGPVDRTRFLALELKANYADGLSGVLKPTGDFAENRSLPEQLYLSQASKGL